jgi:hypothetical protein
VKLSSCERTVVLYQLRQENEGSKRSCRHPLVGCNSIDKLLYMFEASEVHPNLNVLPIESPSLLEYLE